ncbi:ATP-binding cassette sub-family G member 1-like [Cimex lectularius]|uniref:ABC transporter domain-containing protein n=1 Tax=Cimex lectularius TaxID=79782 RepID=A0A8I6RE19_CIMLE|nr:ATP-binding cassette sub-family G member 1-like [Cimex lectularius]
MDIEFEDLTFNVDRGWFNLKEGKRTILKSVNGRFMAGNLSAILGPSGAGKTCLLNAISGYRSAGVNGKLMTNGQPRDKEKFRKASCYITQEDLLVPHLTLNEVMTFAASLKLPSSYTSKQKKTVINEIQIMLGLKECKKTPTDSLSGGQKKRLSIALELINNPPVLFLDEPTSGLDNVSTSNLIRLLRNLAHQGRTIVCTIHQPPASLFKLFDHVYVLAAGYCVYQGASAELVPFLSQQGFDCPTTYNPADFVIELTEDEGNISRLSTATANGKMVKFSSSSIEQNRREYAVGDKTDTVDLFNYGRVGDDCDKRSCSHLPVSCWMQFITLLSRMLLQIKRNKVGLRIQLGNTLFCSLTLAIMFYKMAKDGNQFFNHMKFCIGVIIFHTYTQCMGPILTYPFEVKLVKKELFNQWYGLFPYYVALTFSRVPGIALFNLIYLSIVYPLSGLPMELERFLVFVAVGLSVAFVADGIGLAIGSVFSVTNGAAVGPLSIAPFLGLAIYGFDFARDIPKYMTPLLNLSFMRSGVTALVIAVFGMNREKLECSDPVYCHFQDPEVTLYYLKLQGVSPWSEVLTLVAMVLFYRVVFYLGLKWRFKS